MFVCFAPLLSSSATPQPGTHLECHPSSLTRLPLIASEYIHPKAKFVTFRSSWPPAQPTKPHHGLVALHATTTHRAKALSTQKRTNTIEQSKGKSVIIAPLSHSHCTLEHTYSQQPQRAKGHKESAAAPKKPAKLNKRANFVSCTFLTRLYSLSAIKGT